MALNYTAKEWDDACKAAEDADDDAKVETFRTAVVDAINGLKRFVDLKNITDIEAGKLVLKMERHGFTMRKLDTRPDKDNPGDAFTRYRIMIKE